MFYGEDFQIETGTLDVFYAGCSLKCKGCHNAEIQDPTMNNRDGLYELIANPLVKTVRFMGGEPTEQEGLLSDLVYAGDKIVWLFTGNDSVSPILYNFVDYIKFGPYREELPSWYCEELDLELASSNQWVLDVELGKEYRDVASSNPLPTT